MKKLFAILLSMLMAGNMAACSRQTNTAQSEQTASSAASETVAQTPAPAASETPQEVQTSTGKTLVVYYSSTNHTENVAQSIAQLTGAELFELVPVDPYTSDDLNWSDNDSRVSREHSDESLRNVELVSTTVPNWEDYDTVFIGYPIWWGGAAWPVNGFVTANDFTGKTVIPFCTSSSSGLGESGSDLAKLAGTGDWQEGKRFSSGASQADVQAWLDTLNP